VDLCQLKLESKQKEKIDVKILLHEGIGFLLEVTFGIYDAFVVRCHVLSSQKLFLQLAAICCERFTTHKPN
jgi:hypothetical protein